MTKTIEIEIDEARKLMYNQLADEFGEEVVHEQCEQHIADVLTELYDRKEEIKQSQQDV